MSIIEEYVKDWYNGHYPVNNPEIFKEGDIVYYIDYESKNSYKKDVKFGMVMAKYMGEIALQLFDWMNTEVVNGTPIKEFKTTEWTRIPKGMKCFEYKPKLTEDKSRIKEYCEKYDNVFHKNDKNQILNLIENKILIRIQDKEYRHVEFEYDKERYRFVLKQYPYEYHPFYISLKYDNVYSTFEEAQKVVNDYNNHIEYLRNLSDYDYSIYKINETLDKWRGMYSIPVDVYNKVKDRIMNLDKIEDVDVRLCSGHIEWKYYKNKKWISINE